MNVTALRYMPMWGVEESQAPDGSRVIQYKGSDYQLLSAVADGLNFTFRVLPSQSWAEVRKKEKKTVLRLKQIQASLLKLSHILFFR